MAYTSCIKAAIALLIIEREIALTRALAVDSREGPARETLKSRKRNKFSIS